ncbi:hypothetical protein M2227_003439 [Bradyrhizobium elkanii]|nr:hypothetical protein [Bradyrhizobium elkanii]MCW2201349.1 hypothetical protein [Bradyrhizobium elkanii]
MTQAELKGTAKSNFSRVSPDELFPTDTRKGGSRGTALDVAADAILMSGEKIGGIDYQAIYYFRADRLFQVALVPLSIDDGNRTERLLEGIYGAPELVEATGRDVGSRGCIVRKQWRSRQDGNLVTFFNKCGSRFEVRYEPIPAKGGL